MSTTLRTRAARILAACALALTGVLGGAPLADASTTSTSYAHRVTADDFLLSDTLVQHGAAANDVRIYGKDAARGDYVVMTPSLGRSVDDFTELYGSTITTRLAQAGYRVVLIQPRGIGRSTGSLKPSTTTMVTFVEDVKQSLDALGIHHAHFVGHAYGNRQSRAFAAFHPEYVDDVTLLASGGDKDLSDDQYNSLVACFDLTLPEEQRMAVVKKVFFAEHSDASVWREGWYPALAGAQVAAVRSINEDFFHDAAGKPILLFQALDDFIAPPEMAGLPLKEELGDQVTYVEVPNTGHALTSERPDAIAARMIAYYRQR
jgi:pimeloyl-ACP methyl ester carboxylesterase